MDIAYFPGCTLHASSALYDVQSKGAKSYLKLALEVIEKQDTHHEEKRSRRGRPRKEAVARGGV